MCRRNCLGWIGRGTAGTGQTKNSLGWLRLRCFCCKPWDRVAVFSKTLPDLFPRTAVPVCCRKVLLNTTRAGISPISLLHRTPSSTQCVAAVHGEAAGCGCHRFSLHPGPISGAQLCPHCTAVWICPQSSSMQSAGSSWQQSFLLSDPSTVLLPVLSPCCSIFCWFRRVKKTFLLVPDSRWGY